MTHCPSALTCRAATATVLSDGNTELAEGVLHHFLGSYPGLSEDRTPDVHGVHIPFLLIADGLIILGVSITVHSIPFGLGQIK